MNQAEINKIIKRKQVDFGLLELSKDNVNYNVKVAGAFRLLDDKEYKAIKKWYERIDLCLDM